MLKICAFGSAACAPPEPPPFVVRYTSERLEIGTDFDTKICRGQFDLWEDQIDAIGLDLGLARESAWVYLLNDPEAISQACDLSGVVGCWNGTVIYSETNSVAHELVHAWSMSANPDPLPVLREGLAVRMSGPVSRPNGTYTVSGLLGETVTPFEYYQASHFVAWMIDTYSTDRFMDIYAQTSRGLPGAWRDDPTPDLHEV